MIHCHHWRWQSCFDEWCWHERLMRVIDCQVSIGKVSKTFSMALQTLHFSQIFRLMLLDWYWLIKMIIDIDLVGRCKCWSSKETETKIWLIMIQIYTRRRYMFNLASIWRLLRITLRDNGASFQRWFVRIPFFKFWFFDFSFWKGCWSSWHYNKCVISY